MADLAELLSEMTLDKGPVFTDAEIAAFKEVKGGLIAADVPATEINAEALITVTCLCKLIVDKSIEKYKGLLTTINEYDLTMAQVMDPATMKDADSFLSKSYAPCGTDNEGRGIMWISGAQTQVSEERGCVRAGVLYWMAVHADIHTLREGITFVIDTANQSDKKVGNERKLQKTWQSMPLRPQSLFIVGAGVVKRIFLTALIKFASVFSNSKVLERIRFVEMDAVRKEVPAEQMPHHLGGKKHEDTVQMVHRRLSAIKTVAAAAMADVEVSKKAAPKVVAL